MGSGHGAHLLGPGDSDEAAKSSMSFRYARFVRGLSMLANAMCGRYSRSKVVIPGALSQLENNE